VSQISCSHSLQVLDSGTSSCTHPIPLLTALTALQPYLKLLWEKRALFPSSHIQTGWLTISTVCSVPFGAVNGNNVKDAFPVHRVVLAINDVAICRGLNVININFLIFRLFINLVLPSFYRQKSKNIRPQIYRMYPRKLEKKKILKIN
jgi:hypothetical protein